MSASDSSSPNSDSSNSPNSNSNNSTSPYVTIGLPVYNGEAYLQVAIDSLLAQTFTDFELVIADNCSNDETAEICQRATQDPRVRYVRHATNVGAIENFNFLARQAAGKYFKWAAYDDLCEPDYLKQCVEAMDRHDDAVWCHCKSDQVDEQGVSWLESVDASHANLLETQGESTWWKGHPRQHFDSPNPAQRFAGVLLGTTWSVDSYGLIRSAALRKTRLILPHYGAEKIFIAELALLGRYHHLTTCLFSQRVHDRASSCLTQAAYQARFALGRNQKGLFPRLALLRGHAGAVTRAEISGFNKAKCFCVIARYLLQVRKWGRIAAASLARRGVGGDRPFFQQDVSETVQRTQS